MRHLKCLVVVFLFCLTRPVNGQATLEWQFKEGDSFYLETQHNDKTSLKFAGQAMPTDSLNTDLNKIEVVKATPDTAVLKRTVVSVKVKSQGPAAEEMQRMFERVVGHSLTITVDLRGRKVSRVEGVSDYVRKLVGDNPLLKMMIGASITDDTVKEDMEQAFLAFLPDKPVSAGEKWRRKAPLSFGPLGSFSTDTEFTYAGTINENGRQLDKIEAASELTYSPPAAGAGGLFQVTKGDLKADTAKATYLFDRQAGRLVRSERLFAVKGTLSLNVGGMQTEAELDSSQNWKTRVTEQAPSGE